MKMDFNRFMELESENMILKSEIQRLKNLLEDAGVDYSIKNSNHQKTSEGLSTECIVNENITIEQIDLFITLFHGRTDVYAKRFINKAGNVGYSPACNNFWKQGICPKRDGRKIKCAECPNQSWIKLNRRLLREHLEGHKNDCTDVIGVYPMLADETCNFLVFDFDNHDKKKETNEDEGANLDSIWIEDVNAMRKICENNGIDVLVERSRSGKGAHVWIFFEEAIPATLARKFGFALLTKGADFVNQKNFRSYDRMLPAQDKMPDGGLGNLIALPLQGQALRKGNSAFIDDNWKVIMDPWTLIQNVRKLSKQLMEEKINDWTSDGIFGVLADDMSGEKKEQSEKDEEKPWEKKKKLIIPKEDVDGTVDITLANQIYIKNHNIKARALNRFRRLAAFSNPEFYKKLAMGFSTSGVPRIIHCGSDTDDYVCLPRGLKDKLISLLDESGITYKVNDKKQTGYTINVEFTGNLYPEQEKAAKSMLQYDYGILGAATGFGKTVIGAYIIAQRKVNTIVLVHNREIMKNWIDDFEKFLIINEEFPEYETKKGKRKRKALVGKLYSGHDSLGGIIDVSMITSFGKKGNIDEKIKDYGLVIVDGAVILGLN
ncbi:MAG: DEAD/DEAH box helicase family protein [Clostridiaceae bacterium]|nr:DEAD/DEAH box helicase family protein [Clostridiaceae bacterium]